jgi:hypothetical protein
MKALLAVALCLTGCAASSRITHGPDGNVYVAVKCRSDIAACYEEAYNVCYGSWRQIVPTQYEFDRLGNVHMISLFVECGR